MRSTAYGILPRTSNGAAGASSSSPSSLYSCGRLETGAARRTCRSPGTTAANLPGRRSAWSGGIVNGPGKTVTGAATAGDFDAGADLGVAAGSATVVAPIQSGNVRSPPATTRVPPSPTQLAIAC